MSYQITSEQQQYIESLEWDSEYWDSLPIEVVDSLDPELRELCFEYYDILVAEPVRDDVKLDESPVPVEVVPQEVVSEPQEELSTTTLNEDTMNTITLIPNWEASGYVSVLALDFSTATTTPYIPEVIPDFWEEAVETEISTVNDDLVKPVVQLYLPMGKEVVEVKPVLQPKERPLSNEERETVKFEVAQWATGKKAYVKPYKTELRPYDEIETLARIKESSTPTITTKSGNVVKVSPHVVTPHGNAPTSNSITNPKVTGSIGEAMNPTQLNIFQSPEYTIQVVDCKTELLEADSFDDIIIITRKYNSVNKQIVLDAKVSMTKRQLGYIEGLKKAYRIIKESETVKAPQVSTPVVSTPTVTHNQMMSTIRKMNGGRIPNVVTLNKLVSGYVNRNNTIIASVSKYIKPELLELVDKAYAQLTTA